MKLKRDFFLRPTLEVAKDLLGKHLVYESPEGRVVGEINEVESYIGQDDPACHASASPKTNGKTERTKTMFLEGGHAYIYFTYGMYYCLNVVTEKADYPSAILIRSIIPVEGEKIMMNNRAKSTTEYLANGPGKLCQAYGLERHQNGIDLVTSDVLYLEDSGKKIKKFQTTARIGITKGQDKLWRFHYE